jgi:hypothetical protein
MKITGKRTFTISHLERFEMLVIQAALNDFYKLEINGGAGSSFHGETALRLLNRLNDHVGYGLPHPEGGCGD